MEVRSHPERAVHHRTQGLHEGYVQDEEQQNQYVWFYHLKAVVAFFITFLMAAFMERAFPFFTTFFIMLRVLHEYGTDALTLKVFV